MTIDTNLLRELDEKFQELSMSNYDHDDVAHLNSWGVEAVLLLRPIADELDAHRAIAGGLEKMLADVRGERDALRAERDRLRGNLKVALDIIGHPDDAIVQELHAALKPHPLDTLVTDTHHEWEKP